MCSSQVRCADSNLGNQRAQYHSCGLYEQTAWLKRISWISAPRVLLSRRSIDSALWILIFVFFFLVCLLEADPVSAVELGYVEGFLTFSLCPPAVISSFLPSTMFLFWHFCTSCACFRLFFYRSIAHSNTVEVKCAEQLNGSSPAQQRSSVIHSPVWNFRHAFLFFFFPAVCFHWWFQTAPS